MSLVPELLVASLPRSLAFWRDLIGFTVKYDRPTEGFAFLHLNGAEIMLEELRSQQRNWVTGDLQPPYGRGINLQIDLPDIDVPLRKLNHVNWRLYMAPEETWYATGMFESGQRQFLVQDPDGYLLRLCQTIGTRPLP